MKQRRNALALAVGLAVMLSGLTTAGAQGQGRGRVNRLSGTYQLDRAQSDNPQTIAGRVTQGLPAGQRERIYQSIVNRLDSPETLVIDVNGRAVTIKSNNSATPLAFNADGLTRTETGPNGREVVTRAAMQGGQLVVSMTGTRGNEYRVTFAPIANGLRVTRTLDNTFDDNPVIVQSTYRRTGNPNWGSGASPTSPWTPGGANSGVAAVLVPTGTRLTARLDRTLKTGSITNGERVTVTVTEPASYRGAIIEGTVGYLPSGDRDEIAFDFDSIRLPDGRSATYDGLLQTVRLPDGKTVPIDQSGRVQERNNTSGKIESGAIGAALGAIIGAIAGGTKGAVIGGVAGGAGAVILDVGGSNDRTLAAGTLLTISTMAPSLTAQRLR